VVVVVDVVVVDVEDVDVAVEEVAADVLESPTAAGVPPVVPESHAPATSAMAIAITKGRAWRARRANMICEATGAGRLNRRLSWRGARGHESDDAGGAAPDRSFRPTHLRFGWWQGRIANTRL